MFSYGVQRDFLCVGISLTLLPRSLRCQYNSHSFGGIMVTLTDNAIRELDAYFADKPKSAIRVYLAPGG